MSQKQPNTPPLQQGIDMLDQATMRVADFANPRIKVVRRDEAEAILRTAYALLGEVAKKDKWFGQSDPRGVQSSEKSPPIDMLLFCPRCGEQHIDAPKGDWTNPPHATHTCQHCGLLWRPSNALTNGAAIIPAGEAKHVERIAATWPGQHKQPNDKPLHPDEHTAMLLAAISVAAMCNTRESAAKQRLDKSSPYWTAAYGDVVAAVEREMSLREKLAQSATRPYTHWYCDACDEYVWKACSLSNCSYKDADTDSRGQSG